jgi:hypothetical protein
MGRRSIGLAVIALAASAAANWPQALADPLPTSVGQCSQTTIAEIGSRLQGAPNSGSAISFANGGDQVSYDIVPASTRSRRGDSVMMCLVTIPQGCPPGDDRGRVYTTTNLRTHESWTLPDAQHSCGGA